MGPVNVEGRLHAELLEAIRITAPFMLPLPGSAQPWRLPNTSALAELLYTLWFTRSGLTATGTVPTPTGQRDATSAPLVARLRMAHAATRQFDRGWIARAVGTMGAILAECDDTYLSLAPPDYVNLNRPAAPVRVGDSLAVTARRDQIDATQGWWVTFAAAGPAPDMGLIRIYWNCPWESVTVLVARLTAALRDLGLRYTLKCPPSEDLFDRVEPVVLYLAANQWPTAKPVLRRVHSSIRHRLRSGVPPLTLRLGWGAAVAEDPANGQSYGQSRATAVAQGLVGAVQRQHTDPEAMMNEIVQSLMSNGISPFTPYLRAGSPPDLLTVW